MSPRELVILLLGLAIVAVVLRGLYVAIQARRGQIRLAIDKNIPKDVDLEALEMAELPSGGARVISRGNPDAERVERASERARAMDLDDQDDVPVLMDAIEVRAAPEEAPANDWSGEDNEPLQAADEEIPGQDDDPDAVLMDYGEVDERCDNSGADNLSAVAPDYDEAEADEVAADHDYDDATDWIDEEPAEAVGYETDPDLEEPGFDEADDSDDYEDYDGEEQDSDDDPGDETREAEEGRSEPALGSLDDELDEFSMTAGERIGFEGQSRPAPARQTSLFDDDEEPAGETRGDKKPKRKSLFAAFGRKKSADSSPAADVRASKPKTAVKVEPEPQSSPQSRPQAEPEAPAADITPEEPAATARKPESGYVGQPSEVLVINVMAREGREFRGDDLLHVLITAGLKFGDMNIFHQRLGKDNNSPVIFSVANILNPGTFDLNAMDSFSTVGISFFLALPSPINNLDALEKMLTSAEQIRSALDGELKDDNRNGMTAQTIEHYRQRVRDFQLKQLKAAGGRG